MVVAGLTIFLLFAAFLLLLLVSLSVPIIKTIFVFRLVANASRSFLGVGASAQGAVNFGLWGYCVSAIKVSASIFSDSTNAQCTKTQLGYTIDSQLAKALDVDDLVNAVTKGLTAVLVLHPIACGLTFLALLFALPSLFRPHRLTAVLALICASLATLITTIAFVIDVVVGAVARHRVKDVSDGALSVSFGNAVWLTLGAMIALWLACFGTCGDICACGRGRRRKAETY